MYGETIGWFARFMQRFQATPIQIVKAELKDAELAALQSQSAAEYAALRVKIHTLTATYHAGRIERLREFIRADENGPEQPLPNFDVIVRQFQD